MNPVDTREVTLFIPGLLGPGSVPLEAITEGLAVPALETVFSRGDPSPSVKPWIGHALEGWLCQLVDLPPPQGQDWPIAALTYALDVKARANGWYLRADPVHLKADLDRLVLFDAKALSLSATEAKALVNEINAHYQGQGWCLEAPHPRRWYLRLPQAPRLLTQTLSVAAGAREISGLLPQGEDAQHWRSRLNEIQMLLHASPLNEARQARGELPVNSVWFWGCGGLPPASTVPWQQMWSQDSLSEALARHLGIDHRPRPETAIPWLDEAAPGHHLVVLEQGDALCRRVDVEGWRVYLDTLHRDWFQPLVEALRQRRLHRLTLVTESGRGVSVRSSQLRRWWRRRRPLHHLMAAQERRYEAADYSSHP